MRSILLMWDASALVKRYVPERGSETVDRIWNYGAGSRRITTALGYAETFSVLLRKLNGGRIDKSTFIGAVTLLEIEVLDSPSFEFLVRDDDAVLSGLSLMKAHRINASDAAILAAYLDFQASLPPTDLPCVLVASDHRLLRAAVAEGLPTLDPEAVDAGHVSAFLASL